MENDISQRIYGIKQDIRSVAEAEAMGIGIDLITDRN